MASLVSTIKDRMALGLDRAGMKAIDLSLATGIPKSTISLYLAGHSKPKSDRIYIIAKALNVSEAWLMGFDIGPDRDLISTTKKSYTLTEKESHLVDSYRKLDTDGQADVIDYIDFRLSKAQSVLRDKPSATIIDAPFQVRAAHAHDPNSDGSELKGDFDMLEEAVKNDKLRKNGKKD